MNNLKKYKLNEATSFAVATEFVLQQGANAYIDTTPTLFEIDKLSNQFDTVKISDYVVDILDNDKLSKSQKDEAALSMRQEIVEGINASNLSQDEKEKELLALDNIYKSVGYPTIEEEEEQKNDNTPPPPDEPEEEEIDYKSRAYKKKQNSIFKTIDKNRKNIPFYIVKLIKVELT